MSTLRQEVSFPPNTSTQYLTDAPTESRARYRKSSYDGPLLHDNRINKYLINI